MKSNGKKLVIAIISAIIIIFIIIGSTVLGKNSSRSSVGGRLVNDVSSVFNRVVNFPVRIVKNSSNSVVGLFNTYEENRYLSGKVDEIENVRSESEAIKKENKVLKNNLDLKNSMTDFDLVDSSMISRAPSKWDDQLIINSGSLAGLKKGMAVLSDKGLVGQITQVYDISSKVELISNSSPSANKFSVQFTTDDGNVVTGLINGYDNKKKLLIISQLSNDMKIDTGEKVSTSGIGGLIPSGLYVGTVKEISADDYGLTQKIYIEPSADLDNLTNVLVATNVGGK